jgi:hypothetical protein
MAPLMYEVADMPGLKYVAQTRPINHQPMYAGYKSLHHRVLPCDLPQKVVLQSVAHSLVGACVQVPMHNQGITSTRTPCREKEVRVRKSIVEVPMHKAEISPTQTPCREEEVQVDKRLMEDKQEMTSLVVQNLPASCTREDLMSEWPNHDCAIDLLYMPRKTKGQTQNIAFVNFTSNAAASAFKRRWHRQHLSHGVRDSTQQQLNIEFAKVQGRTAILSLLKKRRVGRMQSQYQPILFQEGVRMSLDKTVAATDKQKTAQSQCRSVAIEPFQFGVVCSL